MKNKIIIGIIVLMPALMSCQKTPSTTIIDNATIENPTSVEIEMSINVDNINNITIVDEEINEVLELEEVTIILKGTVSKPDLYINLYSYKAELVDYNEYESNMTFLFGEYSAQAYRKPPGENFLVVRAEDGYEADIWNTTLVDEGKFTGLWGDIRYFKVPRPVTEDMRKVDMTNEEAMIQADEVMKKTGTKAFEYDECIYREESLQITPEGTLSSPLGDRLIVYYSQKIQDVPVNTTLIEGRKRPCAYVQFDSEGICGVSLSEYYFEPFSLIEQCITYEDALEIFKEYVNKDISYNSKKYNEVRFQYTITKEYVDGAYITKAIPYWYFNREDNPNSTWDPVGDIYINCIDGSVTET